MTRSDAHTLELEFRGGILGEPLLELYRARSLPLSVGTRIDLVGLSIEVLAQTEDGRVSAARFRFAQPLEDPRYRFVLWQGDRYVPFAPPAPGASVDVAAAHLRFGL
jgi:hypothetical protein